MGRRQTSVFDDLVEITAKLPWWGGVVLAAIAYFALHPIAVREVVLATKPGEIEAMVGSQIGKTFAMFGQYLLPFVFLIGSAVSALKQRKRSQLVEQAQTRGQQSALLDMNWHEFEILVGEAFRRRGYTVLETGGNGPDGGVDLVLKKGSETHLVQCKQWKATKVGVDVVRQLYGVMAARGAVGGFVVTSGRFTSDAKIFAEGQNIELIEGEGLLAMIQAAKTSSHEGVVEKPMISVPVSPSCPKCGSSMVRRVAKQGNNAGKAFWGCAAYPKCRGVISIDE